jgi:hypothetical protein
MNAPRLARTATGSCAASGHPRANARAITNVDAPTALRSAPSSPSANRAAAVLAVSGQPTTASPQPPCQRVGLYMDGRPRNARCLGGAYVGDGPTMNEAAKVGGFSYPASLQRYCLRR